MHATGGQDTVSINYLDRGGVAGSQNGQELIVRDKEEPGKRVSFRVQIVRQ